VIHGTNVKALKYNGDKFLLSEQWVTLLEDKFIACKYIIMQKCCSIQLRFVSLSIIFYISLNLKVLTISHLFQTCFKHVSYKYEKNMLFLA